MVKVSERNYVIFVLGYDVFHDKLVNQTVFGYPMECDYAYEICAKIADQFLKSDEYKNMNYGLLHALYRWTDANEKSIYKMIDTWEESNG